MRILACAAIFLVPAAAAAQAPIGLFTELQVETKVDLLAWPESCGKLPVASRIPGRGQVSADVRGGVLLLRSKKAPVLIRSDACTDPDPAMAPGRPVPGENRWELFCSTPAGSAGARTEALKIVFTPPDGLTTTLLTRWGSECKGSEVVTRTFTRTVPTPVAAAEPVQEAPDAGVAEEPGEVVVVASHGGSRPAAASAQTPEEKVELPDVELRALEDDEDYLLPVRELRRKGSFLPLLLGAGLLLLGALALGAVFLRRRRPAARLRAAEPAAPAPASAPDPVPAPAPPDAAPARATAPAPARAATPAPAPAAAPARSATPAPAPARSATPAPAPARAATLASTPAPEGPPPAQLVDDPRADHTAPMTAAVMPGPPASVQVDPALGASVFDPRNADTLQMRASVLRRLDAAERAALDKARFCPACGKQVPVGARFCPHCRSKMPGEPGKP